MSVFNLNNIQKPQEHKLEKPLVLIVDDEQNNIKVLRQLLAQQVTIISANNGQEALELINSRVEQEEIQLIISDQRMPCMTGIELFEQLQEKLPDTIRIILTGYTDTHVIIDAINKAKLYQFMTKPFDPAELSLTVQRGLEAFKMRRDLIAYTEQLEQKVIERTQQLEQKNQALLQALENLEKVSLTDQLTGAHNRRFIHKFIAQELAQLQREHYQHHNGAHSDFGFIMIDMDHFKQINDNYGHDAGDQVLIQLVQILTDTCRESDWVIRWGGEEFLVVGRFIKREELHNLAERIRVNVTAHPFDLGGGVTIQKTCSLGVAAFPFTVQQFDALTWEQTINLADLALYSAKKNGRNAWVSFFENDISDVTDFYQQALDNVQGQIAQGLMSFESSIDKKLISF
jgi:two-component system, cell cycle response regulator